MKMRKWFTMLRHKNNFRYVLRHYNHACNLCFHRVYFISDFAKVCASWGGIFINEELQEHISQVRFRFG